MKKKLKTLLLNLPININDTSDFNGVVQPYGLLIISSFLKQNGFDVTVYDADAHHTPRENLLKYIKEINPCILGLPLMTNHLPQTIPFLKDLKSIMPDLITIVGNAHPSAEPKSLLETSPDIDISVIGEGEHTMLELLKRLEKNDLINDVKGIAYRNKDEIIITQPRNYITDLDSMPFGDWESVPMENYWDAWTTRKNYASMTLSRGCPFGCTFCGAKKILGRKQRRRSVEHIIEEYKLLYDKYNVRNIYFSDSTLNVNNKWVEEICEEMLKSDRKLDWFCSMRADMVKKDTLKLMKKSGCKAIFFGVESADNDMLKRMNKGESIEKIREGINIVQEVGINVDLGFILGLPGETIKSMEKTIKFAKEFKKSTCAFSLAAPFPGTELYDIAKKEGFMIDDWSKFDIYKIAYIPKGLDRKTLEEYYALAVKSTYLRLSFLFWRIIKIQSWLNFKINLRSAYRIFFNRLINLKK